MRHLRSPAILLLVLAVAAAYVLFRILPRPARRHAPPIPDLSATDPLNRPGGSTVPAETYSIYSALYQVPLSGSEPEPLAFADYTSTDIPQVDGSCLRPSTHAEQEMADAFVAANRQSHRFEARFDIPGGYQLLSAAQVNLALTCLDAHASNIARCDPYHQIRHIRFLGAPGFDSTHTHALISVIRKCGRYCGSGGIFAVEKTTAGWHRSDPTAFTENCSWMLPR